MVQRYQLTQDADEFIEFTHMYVNRPKTFAQNMGFLIVGPRHHQWMYDENSLCRLLVTCGFPNLMILKPGKTRIENPGRLNLAERPEESVYVEAKNP